MNSEKAEIEQAQAIGRAAAAQGLKPEDVAFMSKPPKQAKVAKQPSEPTTAKPEAVSEPQPMPSAPSDAELLAKKTAYDKARSEWARGDMSAQELEALYATYMRARAVYSSQQSLYGARLPPENPLPKLNRKLEDALLDRDECQEKLRTARVEESKLKQEKASSGAMYAVSSVPSASMKMAMPSFRLLWGAGSIFLTMPVMDAWTVAAGQA